MTIDQIKTICVVGAGNMGHQIAVNAAIYGFQTWCTDISQSALDKALAFAKEYLNGRVAKGRLNQEQADAAIASLHFTRDMQAAVEGADFVIEAAVERLQVKREVFARLDIYAPSHAILVTNSSFMVSSKVADATKRPEKVCNMHFFNPALVMKVVEVVKGPHTSEETVTLTGELCQRLGKMPVMIHKEIYGFVVNRILNALNREALFLAENGYAAYQDIDIAVEGALNHPMGPFRLMDLTGIDLNYDIATERFSETGDPADRPSSLITAKYKAGEYGKKNGKGFYTYD
jgi:3-hydroxybutyryl-CoA dehydrogenase